MDVDKYLFEPAFLYDNPLFYNNLTYYPHILFFYPHFEKNSYLIEFIDYINAVSRRRKDALECKHLGLPFNKAKALYSTHG